MGAQGASSLILRGARSQLGSAEPPLRAAFGKESASEGTGPKGRIPASIFSSASDRSRLGRWFWLRPRDVETWSEAFRLVFGLINE